MNEVITPDYQRKYRKMNQTIRIAMVESCARCGNDHADLDFQPFTVPMVAYSHFAMCPVLNEPILLVNAETNVGIVLKEKLQLEKLEMAQLIDLTQNWPQPYDPMVALSLCWLASHSDEPELKAATGQLMMRALDACSFWKLIKTNLARIPGHVEVPVSTQSSIILP